MTVYYKTGNNNTVVIILNSNSLYYYLIFIKILSFFKDFILFILLFIFNNYNVVNVNDQDFFQDLRGLYLTKDYMQL